MFFDEGFAFAEDSIDFEDEILAALGHAAHGDDGVAFGVVVGDGKGFAVRLEAVCGALNEVIGSFAGTGIDDFEGRGGRILGRPTAGTGAIEKQSEGRADAVGVLGDHANERLAGPGGVAGALGGE